MGVLVWPPIYTIVYQICMIEHGAASRPRARVPDVASFGIEVRRRRKAAGLALGRLAEQPNLSPHYVSGIENGHHDHSLSTILAIARGLSVGPGDLLGRIGKISPAGLEAARFFDQAPEGVKEGIFTISRATQRREKP